MKKQKHGFWVFIFSLIPGAGEMYMGFKKQGLSIMLLFWGSIALASITGLGCQCDRSDLDGWPCFSR